MQNRDGEAVQIHLVIEEFLPIAGHKFYEVKELLEELNRDEKARSQINHYFEELTILSCETGLTDLKPTNVPLLKDGSGLGIVDSNMLDHFIFQNLYNFGQSDHALIDINMDMESRSKLSMSILLLFGKIFPIILIRFG